MHRTFVRWTLAAAWLWGVVVAGVAGAAAQDASTPGGAGGDLSLSLTQGSWLVEAFGAAGVGDGDGSLYTGHLSVTWFFADGLGVAAQPFAGYIDGEFDDTAVAGLDVLLRWFPVREKSWALFLEGGSGAHYAFPDSFPDGGSHFNFRPMAGLGVLAQLGPVTASAGARYLHISNGNITQPNQGWDGFLLHAGLAIPF